MIKVLYISYDGMTDNLGQSQVIPYLEGLSKCGYSITIISCEKKESYLRKRSLIQDILNESKIIWAPLTYHKSPPVLSSIFDIYRITRRALTLYKREKYSIVHCRSYLPALVGQILKKKHGIKFIFDMRGFWADERIDGNIWNIKNPLYRIIYSFFKRKEREFIESSDAIITLTHAAKIEIESWENSQNVLDKITVIPCCVDLCIFDKSAVLEKDVIHLRSQLSINKDNFVLSYLGSIGTWYLLPNMLDFFILLCDKKDNAQFLFISPEKEHAHILKRVKEKNIERERIIIIESDRNQVANYLSLSSISIFFIKPTYSKKASSPTKQGEIMAMGIPLICNDNVGDVAEIVKQSVAGFIIEDFNTASYQDIIRKLDSSNFDPANIRQNAEEWFSLDKGIALYDSIYKKILK